MNLYQDSFCHTGGVVNIEFKNTFGATFLQTILRSAFLSKEKIEKIQLEKISSKITKVIESNEHHVFVQRAGPSINMKIRGKFYPNTLKC